MDRMQIRATEQARQTLLSVQGQLSCKEYKSPKECTEFAIIQSVFTLLDLLVPRHANRVGLAAEPEQE